MLVSSLYVYIFSKKQTVTNLGKQTEQRLEKEIAKVKQEIKTTTDRLNQNQNNVLKAKETLDQIKKEMKWDENELEKWMVYNIAPPHISYVEQPTNSVTHNRTLIL